MWINTKLKCSIHAQHSMLYRFSHSIYWCANCIRRVWLSFVLSAYCLMLCIRYRIGEWIVLEGRCEDEWKRRGRKSFYACTRVCCAFVTLWICTAIELVLVIQWNINLHLFPLNPIAVVGVRGIEPNVLVLKFDIQFSLWLFELFVIQNCIELSNDTSFCCFFSFLRTL